MGDAFWLRGANEAESLDARRRAQRVLIKETLQAAVRSVVRQAAQLQESVAQPFPLWPGPLCDALLHGLRQGKDLFALLITRFPELSPPKPTSASVTTAAKVGPIVAAALKVQAPKALPASVQGSLIEDTSDMVDKTVTRGDVAGAFLTQARRVLPLLNSSESKCLALVAIGLNLSFLSALLMPVFSNADLRKAYYEDWAFMRDSDDVVLLAAMLHTLDPIDFAISPAPDRIALYLAPPAAADDTPTLGAEAAPLAPKRRAKKKIALIADQTTEARRQREEEEREEQELREAMQREAAMRDEAARAALLEAARREEGRRLDEERAAKEAERLKLERAEREREEERRRAAEAERQAREEDLRRQLAEQTRRNEELLRERERMLEEGRRDDERRRDEERRRAEEAERARLLRTVDERLREEGARRDAELKRAEEERRAADAREREAEAQRAAEREARRASEEAARRASLSSPSLPSPPTAASPPSFSASYSSLAAMERSDALASASSSGGEERRADTDEERLAAIKAARVDAMRRRIAEDVEQRLRRELGDKGAASSSVASLIFSAPAPPPPVATSATAAVTATQAPSAIAESRRRTEEEEELRALRVAADLQREREEKQRQEVLLKKRAERERLDEERRREAEEAQRRAEEERRRAQAAEQAAREEEARRREAVRAEEERRLAALEAQRSEEMRRELSRQEELRRQRTERERLAAIQEQQAAAVRRAEEEARARKAEEEAARRAKDEAKVKTEAERAEALRTLLSDMLAPKRPSPQVPLASASPPAPAALSASPSAGTALSAPLALSRSEPALPSVPPLPLGASRPVPIPAPGPPMSADAPALPLASPSPPIFRQSPVLLPPLPAPATTLAPAALITTVQDAFHFFEESDSGPETLPEVRGAWRTLVGQHDSSDLFASTALAAAPLLRLPRATSPSRSVRGPSPRPARPTSPQASPRGGAPIKAVWAPPRKQLYFRLEPQRPATEQGNVCAGCGKALPSRPLHCEYTNKWFCNVCHTGAKHVIPARVLHHWDLRPYAVSDFAAAFLQSIAGEAVLDVSAVNPGLYELVPQLSLVKAFRRKLGWMKNYVLACRDQANLLRPYVRANRSHLLYSTEMYALRDFLDLSAGSLLPFLEEHYQAWLVHFPRCELCRARAIVCELCRGANGLFFPWERGVARCPRCDSFFHRACTATRRGCPRCARDRAKKQLSAAKGAGASV